MRIRSARPAPPGALTPGKVPRSADLDANPETHGEGQDEYASNPTISTTAAGARRIRSGSESDAPDQRRNKSGVAETARREERGASSPLPVSPDGSHTDNHTRRHPHLVIHTVTTRQKSPDPDVRTLDARTRMAPAVVVTAEIPFHSDKCLVSVLEVMEVFCSSRKGRNYLRAGSQVNPGPL